MARRAARGARAAVGGTVPGRSGRGRAAREPPLRDRSANSRVATIELFFDLVYIFAVTQLSHHLLVNSTLLGALQTALLWALVWLLWAYTTWLTNWLDPGRLEVQVLLVVLMLVSLIMSVALPRAFTGTGLFTAGLIVGATYAVHQIGRAVFGVVVTRGPIVHPEQLKLRCNFQRVLAWCVLSGVLAIGGGLADGWTRGLLWVLAAATEVTGGLLGFPVPRMGRSLIPDRMIEGGHFAERWEAFILIALGESIIITGTTMSRMAQVTGPAIAGFAVAFTESVALWWLYFSRSAKAGSAVMTTVADPGALARTAYHRIHPLMIFGIIVTAASDEKILTHPSAHPSPASTWMILGGPGLFIAGNALFGYLILRHFSWSHLAGVAALGLLAAAAGVLPEIALTACATTVIAALGVVEGRAERRLSPRGTR